MRRFMTESPIQIDLNGGWHNKEGNMHFSSGSHLVVAAESDDILLFASDTAMRFKEIALLRDETVEENYFLLYDEKTKYRGDLYLSAVQGELQIILELDVEEYVAGVVPYEMGEGFPLEALKAQAVAARSYGLSHLGRKKKYDVDDSTNDQVFKGWDDNCVKSNEAVKSTAGVVALYKGKIATCYYGASNGGFIENATNIWPGNTDYSYLATGEDGYDFKNSESIVRRCTLDKEFNGKELSELTKSILYDAIADSINDIGIDQIRIDEIISAIPGKPKYSGSKIMTEISMELRISTRNKIVLHDNNNQGKYYAYGEFELRPETIIINIPFFGKLEDALGLSINNADNEILTVFDIGDSIIFETRRYGHGVGMSQRGAEQMANEGKSYLDILHFYYPKSDITSIRYNELSRSGFDPYLVEVPTPNPTNTPRPTLMPITRDNNKQIAIVSNINDNSFLNLRSAPSMSAEIIMHLYKGQKVFLDEKYIEGWAKVHTDMIAGYVRTQYLSIEQ